MAEWFELAKGMISRDRNLSDVEKGYFRQVVNTQGEIVRGDLVANLPNVRLFLDMLSRQARLDNRMIDSYLEKAVNGLNASNTQIKRFEEFLRQQNTGVAKINIKLSGKVRRLLEIHRELEKKFDERTNLVFLVSPHTFCQPEGELDKQDLDGIVSYLTSQENYNGSGEWRRTPPIDIWRDGNLKVNVMGYIHAFRPRLKFKVVSKNSKEGIEDKLDVEGLFAGENFVGIVHYHTERPYTTKKLVQAGVYPDRRALSIDKVEISRNPDNKAIIADFGDGKRRTYKDVIGDNVIAGTFEFWRSHPDFVGGAIVGQIASALANNPRTREIQYRKAA